MYKRIDFNKLGGLATYQDTLDFLQASYRDSISAIAKAFGSKVIVSGVIDQGSNTYSDGWVVIDGELMPFDAGLKSPRMIVNEISGTELFGDGSTQTVYFTRRATTGITGGYAFSDFIRVDTMSAISEGLKSLVTAHNNLQFAFDNYRPRPEYGDIKNVPTSFNPSSHRHRWDEVDHPNNVLTYLYKGSWDFQDPGYDDDWTRVYFNGNVLPTDRYIVAGSLISLTGGDNGWNIDNDVFWMIKNRTNIYFDLLLGEVAHITQDVKFDYVLIPLD